MLGVLGNTTYRAMFAAQVSALIGTGVSTIALALLAYDLAGGQAAAVLGTALAIKMIAYVTIAPVAGAYGPRLPRRSFLVSLDLVRAGMVGLLPFVTAVWQVYLLIFLFQACSAAFTPTLQAAIPDVLPDERDYTRALSLHRLAVDLETLASPALAGLLLLVVRYDALFAVNAVAFLGSAGFILASALPRAARMAGAEVGPAGAQARAPFWRTVTAGMRQYLRTPRLRGLLALSLAVSGAGAMVIVNTVVYVRDHLALPETAVAVALAASGIGSMLVALVLPRLLDRHPDRPFMLAGAGLLVGGMALGWATMPGLWGLLALWFGLGLASSLVQTPAGRLVRRSGTAEQRPALFAAQFALSHACWLVTYPVAGWLATAVDLSAAFLGLGLIALAGAMAAPLLWRGDAGAEIPPAGPPS